jgi:hypothetical protein
MKKRVLFIGIILLAIAPLGFSQFLSYGIRAGVSSSSVKADELKLDTTTIKTLSKAKVGFHFGVFGRIKIASLYVQPEILFTQTSNDVEVSSNNLPNQIVTQKYNKIDIPVMVGIKKAIFRANVGPVASILLNSKSELKDIGNYEQKFNTATFGFQAGVGLDLFSKLAIDLKYEGNLSKLGNGVKVGGVERNFDTRNSQWILSLGLFL